MHYNSYTKEHGIPVPVALVAVFIFVFVLIRLFEKPQDKHAKEGKTEILQTQIGNYSHNTITFFWRTKDSVEGYVAYGENPKEINKKAYDILDTPKNLTAHRNHLVTIPDLSPQQTYYFMFVNYGKSYSQANGSAFSVTTPRAITTTTQLGPVYGVVIDKSGKRIVDAAVILKIEGIEPLLTRTKQDGSFLLPLCCLYRVGSLEPSATLAQTKATLQALDDNGQSTQITADIADMSPFAKEIVLGKSQDLTSLAINEKQVLKEQDGEVSFDTVDIIFPKQEAGIPGAIPLIKGVALSGKEVKGIIKPSGEVFEVQANKSGIWAYIPKTDLLEGKHTLSVQSKDKNNRTIGKERVFFVLKSGEAVLGEATPSGKLTPPQESPTPTIIETPIISMTLTPTPPVTGIDTVPFVFISTALIIFGMGLILVF